VLVLAQSCIGSTAFDRVSADNQTEATANSTISDVNCALPVFSNNRGVMATEQAAINYYDILGVSPTATTDAIRAAYLARINQYHPDRNRFTHANAVTALINEAWQVLGDPGRRQLYDARMGFNARKESHEESDSREQASDARGSETPPPPPTDPPPPPPPAPKEPESDPSPSPESPLRRFAQMSLSWKLYILAWAWFGVILGLTSERNGTVVAFTIWLFGGSAAWLLTSVVRRIRTGWKRIAKIMIGCVVAFGAMIFVLALREHSDIPPAYLFAIGICVVLTAFVLFINKPKAQQGPAPSPDTCPDCGTTGAWVKRRDGAESCWRCGKSRSEGEPATGPATSTEHRSAYVLAAILITGGFASPVLNSGDVAQFGGLWLGALVLPFLIAHYIASRRSGRFGFGRAFFWMALIICPLVLNSTATKTSRTAVQQNADPVASNANQLTATPNWFEANAPVRQQGRATSQGQATGPLADIDRSEKTIPRRQSSDTEQVEPVEPAHPLVLPQSMSQQLNAKCVEDAGRILKRIRGDKPEEFSTNYSPQYERCYLLRIYRDPVDDRTASAEFWDVSDGSVVGKATLTSVGGTPGSVTGPGTVTSCQIENGEESTGSCIRLKELIADHMRK
jgi:hypothetical protein